MQTAVATKQEDKKAKAATQTPQTTQPVEEFPQDTIAEAGIPLYMQRAANSIGSIPPPAEDNPPGAIADVEIISQIQNDLPTNNIMRMSDARIAQPFDEAQEALPEQPEMLLAKSATPLYMQRICAECKDNRQQSNTQNLHPPIEEPGVTTEKGNTSRRVQTKITVSAPGDQFEQEADEVADQVVSGQKVSRISRIENTSGSSEFHRQSAPPDAANQDVEEKTIGVQPKTEFTAESVAHDSELESQIKSPASGSPLPEGMRREMEAGISADFSDVRVHDSETDRTAAAQLNAKAFTFGNHIWLGPGAAVQDRKLMAHELTHVVQQGGAVRRTTSPNVFRNVALPGKISMSQTSNINHSGTTNSTLPVATSQSIDVQATLIQRDDDGWDILGGIRRRINSLVDGLRSGWDTVSNIATSAFEGFSSFLGSAMTSISGLVNSAISGAQQSWSIASDTVTQLANGVREQLGGWVSSVTGAAAAIRDGVMRMDANAIRAAWQALQGLIGNVWNQLQQAQSALFERITALWEGIKTGFEAAWNMALSVFRAIYDNIANVVNGIRERIEGAWETVRQRAAEMGGIAGDVVRVIQAAVERLMSWARDIWDGIQRQWNVLKNRIGELLSSAREQMTGFWDTLKNTADVIWESIKSGWQSLKDWAIEIVSDLVSGVRDIWQRITGFSIEELVLRIADYFGFVEAVQRGLDDPDAVLQEYAGPIAAQLEAGMPAEAQGIGQENMSAAQAQISGESGGGETTVLRQIIVQREERSVTSFGDLWAGFTSALDQKWQELNILDLVTHLLWTLIWPWPTVAEEFGRLWEDWTNSASDLFIPRNPFEDPIGTLHDLWSNVLILYDFVLAFWRRINNIVLALMGWITVALMIIGAIGGTIGGTVIGAIASALASFGIATGAGAAAGGAAGGFTGAGAGFGVALGIGELFVYSFALAEGASLIKMFVNLLTARLTDNKKEHDFNQAVDNVLALGILAVLLALAWLAGRIASAAAVLFKKVELPPGLRAAAEQFREGMETTRPRRGGKEENRETKEEETPAEETPAEEVPEERPVEQVPGKTVLQGEIRAALDRLRNVRERINELIEGDRAEIEQRANTLEENLRRLENEVDAAETTRKIENLQEEVARAKEDLNSLESDPLIKFGLRSQALDAIERLENIKSDPVGDVNQVGNKNHYRAARLEAEGEVVARRPDGRPYDHIRDLQEGYNGLENVRNTLEREINNPPDSITSRGLDLLLDRYSEVQAILSRLRGFLHQIGQAPPYPPFHEWPPGS